MADMTSARVLLTETPLERARRHALYLYASAVYDYDLPPVEHVFPPRRAIDTYGGCPECRAWVGDVADDSEWERHCRTLEHLAALLGLDTELLRLGAVRGRHELGERRSREAEGTAPGVWA